MSSEQIDYGRLVERALRHVVHDALDHVAENGLPGGHHLYITFRTDHEDVVLADELHVRYPSEMTVVLQHEFWGLEVRDDGFAVTLSFGNRPQRIEVPFEAVTVFADPSVEFGLQFAAPEALKPETGEAGAEAPQGPAAQVAELPQKRADEAAADGGAAEKDDEAASAEVVTLDRFRKK